MVRRGLLGAATRKYHHLQPASFTRRFYWRLDLIVDTLVTVPGLEEGKTYLRCSVTASGRLFQTFTFTYHLQPSAASVLSVSICSIVVYNQYGRCPSSFPPSFELLRELRLSSSTRPLCPPRTPFS
ncbi:hypothetical protein BU25DRAFT_415780 [Macroventuria anomochaeta]|uniref:Uncharacterized protein n=2 Tax=Macroventuria anomochaeta TaxID=301207 RepID=A0ACB6RGS8_9PLEO|nr:uncharacterized protein BU25DRAFT_416364 [Macroventuria anomochaeta]XP_033555955.1 uncharacterized protein BU25DRAFT_415780 [Macroventuria anomochaeta]KAF2621156.1 hypothetical protein BU25DRAFT_416364 [Macroventuria anomochaeta]KAF2621752.1 hypothetical protein BU25DRAFT_415780 [Macroventuria anomochaeta]